MRLDAISKIGNLLCLDRTILSTVPCIYIYLNLTTVVVNFFAVVVAKSAQNESIRNRAFRTLANLAQNSLCSRVCNFRCPFLNPQLADDSEFVGPSLLKVHLIFFKYKPTAFNGLLGSIL